MSHTIYDILPTLAKTGIARRASVEVALTRMCDPRLSIEPEALLARIEALEKTVKMLRHAAPAPSTPAAVETPAPTVSVPVEVPSVEETVEGDQVEPPISYEIIPEPQAAEEPKEMPKEAPSQVGGWRQVLEEFGGMYPYYNTILTGSKASIKDGKLVLYMRDHLFVNNFQSNKKALGALMSMVAQETGKEITDCVIERIKGEQIDVPTDETFF